MEHSKSQPTKRNALVLTVGTGDQEQLKQTLIDPIKKSINDGSWDTVVLLPSQETVPNAERILSTMDDALHIICRPLDTSGLETNADECFGHFDYVLEELINQGFDKTDITLDFTRGTKAMSAALLMAGMSREIPNIRYISGKQRDRRGMVIPGAEVPEEINTQLVDNRRLLNQAERLMQRGSFEAVCILIQSNPSSESTGYLHTMQSALQEINAAARVYRAWDRFDYKDAIKRLNDGQKLFCDNTRFAPIPAMRRWLEALAVGINLDNTEKSAIYVQRLACDMLANAERRKRDGLYEDAYVRCYRVLELIGQYCLFEKGYDSGKLPENDENIIQLGDYLEKKRSAPLGKFKSGKKSFARAGQFQVTRLLDILHDSRGSTLRVLGDKRKSFLTQNRNKSLLFHGFSAANTEQIKNLDASMNDLEKFLCDDFPEAKNYLAISRSINFSHE